MKDAAQPVVDAKDTVIAGGKATARASGDFFRGLLGDPATPASTPTTSASPLAVQAPRDGNTGSPIPRGTTSGSASVQTSQRANVRAAAQIVQSQIQIAPQAKVQISDDKRRAIATRLARLQLNGSLTSDQVMSEIDTQLGTRKPAHYVDLADRIVALDKQGNPMGSFLKGVSADTQLRVGATLQAARMVAMSKIQEGQNKDARNLFKDREDLYTRVENSYGNKTPGSKDEGRRAVARIDATVESLGLDIRSPGISAMIERAEGFRKGYIKRGWWQPSRNAADYQSLKPFVIADSLGLEPTSGDALKAANEVVISPLHFAAQGTQIPEDLLVGGVVNAVGYGVPADEGAALLAGFVKDNPNAFANATPSSIGRALRAHYETLLR